MAKVDMNLVKQLRETTQVSLMDCRKALEESQGDMEKAIDLLRKKGAGVVAKRAEHAVENGRIEAYISSDFKTGSLTEVGCETDFSANTDDMKQFAIAVAKKATEVKSVDGQAILEGDKALHNRYNELLAKISEKIQINRIELFSVQTHGIVSDYIHPGSTVGVLVELEAAHDPSAHLDLLKVVARDICMHIAVMKPLGINPQDLDQALVEKERSIIEEQLKETKKPANIIAKIAEGKLSKFYTDVCLSHQAFIKRDEITIEQYLKETSEKTKNTITIKRFARFGIGKK